jgi:serine/threonine protein kinase
MNWVGLTLEHYAIDARIGEGSFAWIFRGVSESGDKRAFKVAKPHSFIGTGMRTGVFCTKTIRFRTNGIYEAVPDAQALLSLEYEKLKGLNLPCLPRYFSHVDLGHLAYLQMELLEGQTLLQIMQSGGATLPALKQAALAVASLGDSGLPYHGDLTPENIFFAGAQVKLLDPGHLGDLKLSDSAVKTVLVTTPEFYPLLKPDDVLALGLILWQTVMGSPLIDRQARDLVEAGVASDCLAPETLVWIESQERLGNFYVSALRAITLPRLSGLGQEQEAVLLKSVRLALNVEGKIVRDAGYASADQLAHALKVFGV